jgi:HK97 family phage prohead protease
MAIKLRGNPQDVKKYRDILAKQGKNTKRAGHPVYKNKPDDFRVAVGTLKMMGKKGEENEEGGEQGEEGTTDGTKYDPARKLIIAGMANANIVDRYDERVDPRGGEFENFMKNPVLLSDHMYWTGSVIGKVLAVTPEDAGTSFEAEVGDPTKGPLTKEQEDIRNLIAQGYLNTVSIGFIPLEIQAPVWDDQGRMQEPAVILRYELLEISVVAIPANPEATFEMKEFVENRLALNGTNSNGVNGLTTPGTNAKNNNSGNQNTNPGNTGHKKGLDSMDEEQVKEMLEGIKGIGTGITTLAESQKTSNESIAVVLELLKKEKMPEEDDDDEDEEKEKRLKAIEDAVEELKKGQQQTAEIFEKILAKVSID